MDRTEKLQERKKDRLWIWEHSERRTQYSNDLRQFGFTGWQQFTENTYFGKNMDTGTIQIATLTRIILSRLLLF